MICFLPKFLSSWLPTC